MFRINFILLLPVFTSYAFTQSQNTSTEEEAVKEVIMNETKTWAKRNYEEWAKNWAHENYVFKMFSGYGDSIQYGEKLGWDSVKADAKYFFNKYIKPFDLDISWSDWNIRSFNNCAWAYYIQTNIFEGDTQNPIRYREVRFLEKKNGDWKIVLFSCEIYRPII